jgi:hypothetical protein
MPCKYHCKYRTAFETQHIAWKAIGRERTLGTGAGMAFGP